MGLSATCPMSGRYGAIGTGATAGSAVPRSTITAWQVSIMQESKQFAASNTHGGTGRRAGLFDWSGTINQMGGRQFVLPGDVFEFHGYAGPGDGNPASAAGPGAIGMAILESLSTTWDWVNNDIVKNVYNMVGNGPLTPASTAVKDTSQPVTTPASQCNITIQKLDKLTGAPGGALDLCFQSAVLNVLGNPRDYSNSCFVYLGNGWKGRKMGTLDWNMALVMDEADVTKHGLQPGDYVQIVATVSNQANDDWQLLYGIIKDFTNYNVNIETGDIITVTMNVEMSFDNGVGTTIGHIKPPGTTAIWWPVPGSLVMAADAEVMAK